MHAAIQRSFNTREKFASREHLFVLNSLREVGEAGVVPQKVTQGLFWQRKIGRMLSLMTVA